MYQFIIVLIQTSCEFMHGYRICRFISKDTRLDFLVHNFAKTDFVHFCMVQFASNLIRVGLNTIVLKNVCFVIGNNTM